MILWSKTFWISWFWDGSPLPLVKPSPRWPENTEVLLPPQRNCLSVHSPLSNGPNVSSCCSLGISFLTSKAAILQLTVHYSFTHPQPVWWGLKAKIAQGQQDWGRPPYTSLQGKLCVSRSILLLESLMGIFCWIIQSCLLSVVWVLLPSALWSVSSLSWCVSVHITHGWISWKCFFMSPLNCPGCDQDSSIHFNNTFKKLCS